MRPHLLRTAAFAFDMSLRTFFAPAEWKADSDKLTAKLRELDALQGAYTETEEEMVEYVLTFSELMKRTSSIFKLANDIERRKIVHLVFTELTLFDGKLVAYKATEGMELFLKRPVGVNGGRWLT